MQDIPFTLFDDEVRAHAPRDLASEAARLFDEHFPGFRHLREGDEVRFAGDRTLDRGWCFTPCGPTSAGDLDALVAEIEAHRDRSLARQPRLEHAGDGLSLVFPDTGESFSLPLRTARLRLEHVIDLRLSETQRWFADTFVPLETQIRSDAPRDFEALLPTLLASPPGAGPPFVRAVGAWLRCHRATALIHPSAHVDSGATFEDGTLTDSWGASLMVYLGATAVPWEPLFGLQPAWLPEGPGLRFTSAADGWRIERGAPD